MYNAMETYAIMSYIFRSENSMYYPIQIPYILNKAFADAVTYREYMIEAISDIAICQWEMESSATAKDTTPNIIIPDGCIDLVIDYQTKMIGFSGMSQTEFNAEIPAHSRFFGIRLRPGAFYQLTNISADQAMDNFISITDFDPAFDLEQFFMLPFTEGKQYINDYLCRRANNISTDFISLFDELYETSIPLSGNDLYEKLNLSPRQCQRLFLKQYGISPKMVICVARFQQSLKILTSKSAKQSDIAIIVGYYDQPHYIRDVKKNIGITPLELIKRYQ